VAVGAAPEAAALEAQILLGVEVVRDPVPIHVSGLVCGGDPVPVVVRIEGVGDPVVVGVAGGLVGVWDPVAVAVEIGVGPRCSGDATACCARDARGARLTGRARDARCARLTGGSCDACGARLTGGSCDARGARLTCGSRYPTFRRECILTT